MIRCPACDSQTSENSRYCPSCATPLEPVSEARTRTSLYAATRKACAGGEKPRWTSSSGASLSRSSDSLDEGRFIPGALVAGRYRIIGLLGRGGMGEVYRADDLKLGQPVALKFLPEALAQDRDGLARFFNEVRTSRQVTHPNVCRVYDIAELDGQHFLSMEYVDGEDLASLLRRIGRLPQDKAIQMARQLCAGLAAAHEQGILHRDLKPANIMIDGRGRIRITDFGLAGVAREIAPAEVRVGTPAYMAPEQLAGTAVSVKSDIYSLGLVLYELFTGKPAFKADSQIELVKMQQETTPASPSSVVGGLEPAVERVILRCLEKDPRHRPASALAVAASLPGGDPLAAALAAGETPSPEMVAEAGELGGLHPAAGLACLILILLGLVVMVVLSGSFYLDGFVALQTPPEALAVKAREIAGRLGYPDPPTDAAYGFSYDDDYLRQIQKQDFSPHRWDKVRSVRPAPISFWYRQSPRNLIPENFVGMVTASDPPSLISGMLDLRLDPKGRLLGFLAIPPEREAGGGSRSDPEWSLLFHEAGLDLARFSSIEPVWNPPIDCQVRAAWDGAYIEQPAVPIHVEACAYGGKPAFFRIVTPWTSPRRMEPVQTEMSTRIVIGIVLSVIGLLLAAGMLLARRNLRLGRGDRKGAFRVALYVFSVSLLSDLLRLDHVPELSEIHLVLRAVQSCLLLAGMVWLIYIALEPYVRRLWPDALFSWSRLLEGRFKDPRIGRDILVGGVAGILFTLGSYLLHGIWTWLGFPGLPPYQTQLGPLIGLRHAVGVWLASQANALLVPIFVLFLLLLLRVLCRREWIAVGIVLLFFVGIGALGNLGSSLGGTTPAWLLVTALLLVGAIFWSMILFVLIRFGVLAMIILFFFANLRFWLPLTLDPSAWYMGQSLVALLAMAALAVYGFAVSLGGRTLLAGKLLPQV